MSTLGDYTREELDRTFMILAKNEKYAMMFRAKPKDVQLSEECFIVDGIKKGTIQPQWGMYNHLISVYVQNLFCACFLIIAFRILKVSNFLVVARIFSSSYFLSFIWDMISNDNLMQLVIF